MRVRWVEAARQDRADIVEYIAAESPSAAIRIDQLFSSAVARLEGFPLLGRIGTIPGTRELIPHESYRLIYEVDKVSATVWILALVHTARRWPP